MKWATDRNGRRYPLMDNYEEMEAERREDERQELEFERRHNTLERGMRCRQGGKERMT